MKKITKLIFIIIGAAMAALFVAAGIQYFAADDAEIAANCLFACGQAALFMAVNFVPLILTKMKLYVEDFVYIIFLVFCLAHFLFGEILGFFALITWWDSALHTISGALITILACSVVKLLSKSGEENGLGLAGTLIFAFCITITVGVIWEVVEFAMDGLFGLNMQRAYLSNPSGERGTALVGSVALLDTMKDLILDALGAFVVCVVIAVIAKKKKFTMDKIIFIKRMEENSKN